MDASKPPISSSTSTIKTQIESIKTEIDQVSELMRKKTSETEIEKSRSLITSHIEQLNLTGAKPADLLALIQFERAFGTDEKIQVLVGKIVLLDVKGSKPEDLVPIIQLVRNHGSEEQIRNFVDKMAQYCKDVTISALEEQSKSEDAIVKYLDFFTIFILNDGTPKQAASFLQLRFPNDVKAQLDAADKLEETPKRVVYREQFAKEIAKEQPNVDLVKRCIEKGVPIHDKELATIRNKGLFEAVKDVIPIKDLQEHLIPCQINELQQIAKSPQFSLKAFIDKEREIDQSIPLYAQNKSSKYQGDIQKINVTAFKASPKPLETRHQDLLPEDLSYILNIAIDCKQDHKKIIAFLKLNLPKDYPEQFKVIGQCKNEKIKEEFVVDFVSTLGRDEVAKIMETNRFPITPAQQKTLKELFLNQLKNLGKEGGWYVLRTSDLRFQIVYNCIALGMPIDYELFREMAAKDLFENLTFHGTESAEIIKSMIPKSEYLYFNTKLQFEKLKAEFDTLIQSQDRSYTKYNSQLSKFNEAVQAFETHFSSLEANDRTRAVQDEIQKLKDEKNAQATKLQPK